MNIYITCFRKSKLRQTFILSLLSGILCCCTDERESYSRVVGDGKSVSFSVRVPGSGIPKTSGRMLNPEDENEVLTIEILLFDSEGKYTSAPLYTDNITTDPDGSNIKTFTVKVPEGTYDMVILANARKSLSAALGNITTGDYKAAVLSKLLLSNNGKWNANISSEGYIPIPMWGEIKNITVSAGMPAVNPVSLVRMVAKIDVSLSTSEAKDKFNLESIRLYNYNDKGLVAPDEANWNEGTLSVTAPSVPASAQKPSDPASMPLIYEGEAITKDENRGISCSGEIYTFEAPSGTDSSMESNTCLVIGGTYDGDAQPTYYRVDIANTTGTGAGATTTYLPILRNHNYRVNIAAIKGPGLVDPEVAFRSRPVNIEASVINWSDGQITDVVFDGQYMMGVSQGKFIFSREARELSSSDNTLLVTTDFPSGWKVDKIVDASSGNNAGWISLSPTSGEANSITTTRLLLSENDGSGTRTANVHLTAGRLNYIMKVEQSTTVDVYVSITNSAGDEISILDFVSTKQDVTAGTLPASQQFKINWSPASSDLFFTSTTASNPFTYFSGTGLDQIPGSGSLNDPNGTKTYTIQPPVITQANLNNEPFYERNSTYLYTVSDGLVTASKTLTLRQYVYNMVPVVEAAYLMDGARKSFGVRSNSSFTVTVKSDANNVVSNISTSGTPNTSANGTPVYFDVVDDLTNPTLHQKDVVITIKSPTGLFPDMDVTLNCVSGTIQPKSNSYIVAPNSTGILIPVSRANDSSLGTQLGASEAFTADLVWTDNSNRIAANSNIKAILTSGDGTSGYVFVMPGSASGNVVVAIKNSSNKILWSWHIWVTDYNPSAIGTGKFMDRNLGAIGNTPGQASTKGMLYQWGRKDAFPGSTGSAPLNGNVEPTIYNALGSVSIIKTTVSSGSNFANSVANPSTYYYGTSNSSYDWYGATTYNNSLWGHNSAKTVYDPCPSGWRVPQNGVWNGLTTSNFIWGSYGRTNAGFGGFYPASGLRGNASGELNRVGDAGHYWSASPDGDRGGYYMSFSNSDEPPNNRPSRAYGFSVRCVQE